jgi:hypothetical protein
VVTDHIPAPNDGVSDLTCGSRAAVSVVPHVLGSERHTATLRGHTTESQRSARWRVLLVSMMGLDDFDVEVSGQGSRRLAYKLEQ